MFCTAQAAVITSLKVLELMIRSHSIKIYTYQYSYHRRKVKVLKQNCKRYTMCVRQYRMLWIKWHHLVKELKSMHYVYYIKNRLNTLTKYHCTLHSINLDILIYDNVILNHPVLTTLILLSHLVHLIGQSLG